MGLCRCPFAGRRVRGGGQGCAIGCCNAGQGPRAAVAGLGPPSALGSDVLSLLGQLLAALLRSPRLSLQRLRSCRREAVQLSGADVALQQLPAPRCGLLGSPSRSHIAMVLQLHAAAVSRHLQHLQVRCRSAAATSAPLTDIQLKPSHEGPAAGYEQELQRRMAVQITHLPPCSLPLQTCHGGAQRSG